MPDVKLSPDDLDTQTADLHGEEYPYVVGWLLASDPDRPLGQELARALAAVARRRAEQGS